MRFSVTTVDMCVQGFERLRAQDEFILVAYPSPHDKPADVIASLLDEARRIDSALGQDLTEADGVRLDRAIRDEFEGASGLGSLLASLDDQTGADAGDGDTDNPVMLFVYVKVEPEDLKTAFASAMAPLTLAAPTESASAPDGGFRASLWLGPAHVGDVSVFPDGGPIRLLYRANEKAREDGTIRTWWMSNDFADADALRKELGL